MLLVSAASAALALFVGAVTWILQPELNTNASSSAFLGAGYAGRLPRRLRERGARVVMNAEVVDVETIDSSNKAPGVKSVFDGTQRSGIFTRNYNGTKYLIIKSNWTYQVRDPETKATLETGEWLPEWNMPKASFDKRRKTFLRRWRAKKRKLRIKHGMGQRWPNGKLIYLTKLQCSPFTKEFYGQKYVGKAPWLFSANEVPARERQMRALTLKRQMEQAAEEKRIARLRELGVWPGEQSWRRPWQPQVDLSGAGAKPKET